MAVVHFLMVPLMTNNSGYNAVSRMIFSIGKAAAMNNGDSPIYNYNNVSPILDNLKLQSLC